MERGEKYKAFAALDNESNLGRIVNSYEQINYLLKDGFSRKFATYYSESAKKELSNPYFDQTYVQWAHENGFLAENAYAYGLNEENKYLYLSDYDYYKMWPINNWTRIWVDDKLTLKQMLDDTEFGSIMPDYYCYSFKRNGKTILYPIKGLHERTEKVTNYCELISLIKREHIIACKPCNGTGSQGFYKLEYKGEDFFINDARTDDVGVRNFISEHYNYVFTEYLYPAEYYAKIASSIHTLRIVVINTNNSPQILGGYLRFPNSNTGAANYIAPADSTPEKFNIFSDVDFEKGTFGPTKFTFVNKTEWAEKHPDTNMPLAGEILNFGLLKRMILGITEKFSTLEFLGFDIGITTKGFKCMEINTHPGIKYLQIFHPFFADERYKTYFSQKLEEFKGNL